MGAQLAMTAYTYWSQLPHRPFRLLVRMALTAKDSDPEPRAWLGREALAEALGLKPTPSNFRHVRECLRVLKDAGAVECVEVGGFNRRSTYLIHAQPRRDLVDKPVDKIIRAAVQGARSGPPVGARSGPPVGARFGPPVGARFGPPEEPIEEPMKEYGEENHVASTYSR